MIVWTDDCADADNTKLGSRVTDGSDSWAVVSGFSEASVYLEVLSNALSANSNISRTWYYVNLDPGSNDYYCQADFKIDASSKVSPAISVRQSASAETLYLLRWSSGWFLRRIVAGSATTLASGTTTNSPVSAPVTGYLEIIDNGANADYTVKAGGSTIYSGTDTSAITARGYAGAGAYFADLGASRYIDNLICGTVAAGGGAVLSGSLSGTCTKSGDLVIGVSLSGAPAYSVSQFGTVSPGSALVGLVAPTMAQAGALQTQIQLVGELSVLLSQDGPLQIGATLQGGSNVQCVAVGDLSLGQIFHGALDHVLMQAGILQVGRFLSGTLASLLTSTGTLVTSESLGGNIAGQQTISGGLQSGQTFSGAVAFATGQVGSVRIGTFLAGAVSYAVTHGGVVQVGDLLAGISAYSAALTGDLQIGKILEGQLGFGLTHSAQLVTASGLVGTLTYQMGEAGALHIGLTFADSGGALFTFTMSGTLLLPSPIVYGSVVRIIASLQQPSISATLRQASCAQEQLFT